VSGFTVETREGLESLVLHDAEGKGQLTLAPARGGMATRLVLGGKDVFYLDEATLEDVTKNVRGGNPVLFPQPGKLTGDLFANTESGKKGAMKQHGFARNLPWEVLRTSTTGSASATLRLVSTATTRTAYPWDFVAEYTYKLTTGQLRIEQRFENTSADTMLFGAGFHPYFLVPQADKAAAEIGTRATRAFDNTRKKDIVLSGIDGIDLTANEVDLHLYDHGTRPCTLAFGGRERTTITLRGSREFSRWVVWTLTGKDFVCVEPWTCPGDALNTGDDLIALAPGEARTLWVEIARS
jgi:galactose mutarotase-like enzyme